MTQTTTYPVPYRPLGVSMRATLAFAVGERAPDSATIDLDALWAVMCEHSTVAGFPSITQAIAILRDGGAR